MRPRSSPSVGMGVIGRTVLVALFAAVVADSSEAVNETSDDVDFQEWNLKHLLLSLPLGCCFSDE